MTSHLPNLQYQGIQGPAIYRPRYRPRKTAGGYLLEGTHDIDGTDTSGLFTPVQALESWRKMDEERDKSRLAYWRPEKATNLLLYIDIPAEQPEFERLVLRACREWEGASGGLIHLEQTLRKEQADILLSWGETPSIGRDFEVGHTERTLQGNRWITKAVITLMKRPKIDSHLDLTQQKARLYTTVLHEMGHALGLEHSKNPKDVMYHQGWQNQHLSTEDIQNLISLYQNPVRAEIWV